MTFVTHRAKSGMQQYFCLWTSYCTVCNFIQFHAVHFYRWQVQTHYFMRRVEDGKIGSVQVRVLLVPVQCTSSKVLYYPNLWQAYTQTSPSNFRWNKVQSAYSNSQN